MYITVAGIITTVAHKLILHVITTHKESSTQISFFEVQSGSQISGAESQAVFQGPSELGEQSNLNSVKEDSVFHTEF